MPYVRAFILRYVRVVSLSSAPSCEPDIVTQLVEKVEKVSDVIGDWLSEAKKSILGRDILDSVESSSSSTATRYDAAGGVELRNTADSQAGREISGKITKDSPSNSKGKDISDKKDSRAKRETKKSRKKHKKRSNYFGSKDRPKGDHSRSSEGSEDSAIKEDSRHDGAGRKIFVCSGRWMLAKLYVRLE